MTQSYNVAPALGQGTVAPTNQAPAFQGQNTLADYQQGWGKDKRVIRHCNIVPIQKAEGVQPMIVTQLEPDSPKGPATLTVRVAVNLESFTLNGQPQQNTNYVTFSVRNPKMGVPGRVEWLARELSSGREIINLVLKPKDGQRRRWNGPGQLALDANGQVQTYAATFWKLVDIGELRISYEDRPNQIAREVASFMAGDTGLFTSRPPFWGGLSIDNIPFLPLVNSVQDMVNLVAQQQEQWKGIKAARKAVTFDPNAATYGFAAIIRRENTAYATAAAQTVQPQTVMGGYAATAAATPTTAAAPTAHYTVPTGAAPTETPLPAGTQPMTVPNTVATASTGPIMAPPPIGGDVVNVAGASPMMPAPVTGV